MSVGERIKKFRKEKGLTQVKLAGKGWDLKVVSC